MVVEVTEGRKSYLKSGVFTSVLTSMTRTIPSRIVARTVCYGRVLYLYRDRDGGEGLTEYVVSVPTDKGVP